MQLVRSLAAIGVAVATLAAPGIAAAQWKPTRPINIIVPWAAGGATDQLVRVTASELEKALGQKIVVLNQPGASGSVGTKNAMDAPRDGYTWTSGAPKDLGIYRVLGMLDTGVRDWHLYLALTMPCIVSVNVDSPYKDMKQLLDALRTRGDQIAVATAGVNSSGHTAMESIAKHTGIKYRHVTYDGGNPAVIATVAGETQVTPQLASEQVEMIRAKRLRPLAVVGDKPLEVEGFGRIPALSEFVPGFREPFSYFGIFIPKGVPDEVVQTMNRIWTEQIAKSEAVRKYAASRGALFVTLSGEEAQKASFPAIQSAAWTQFDAGKAKVSPDTVGIPRP